MVLSLPAHRDERLVWFRGWLLAGLELAGLLDLLIGILGVLLFRSELRATL